jgi:hypothetical protein
MLKRGVFGFGFVAGFKWGFPSCLRGPLGLSPTERIGKVSYKLELPPELAGVHPVFHVSHLRKCVVVEKRVPAQALDVQETLKYLEYPVQILDWAKKSTRKTTTRF